MKLGLPDKGSKTFDLAAAPAGVRVAVDLWDEAPEFSPYCTDIAGRAKKSATWKATKGKLTITLHGPTGQKGRPDLIRASARLEGVVFEDGAGQKAILKEETIPEIQLGWVPG